MLAQMRFTGKSQIERWRLTRPIIGKSQERILQWKETRKRVWFGFISFHFLIYANWEMQKTDKKHKMQILLVFWRSCECYYIHYISTLFSCLGVLKFHRPPHAQTHSQCVFLERERERAVGEEPSQGLITVKICYGATVAEKGINLSMATKFQSFHLWK